MKYWILSEQRLDTLFFTFQYNSHILIFLLNKISNNACCFVIKITGTFHNQAAAFEFFENHSEFPAIQILCCSPDELILVTDTICIQRFCNTNSNLGLDAHIITSNNKVDIIRCQKIHVVKGRILKLCKGSGQLILNAVYFCN